ncbi:hypothetical protein [Helicobacter enhydrae]|nr:hypothetical protein [Helicobacter enhydrae]
MFQDRFYVFYVCCMTDFQMSDQSFALRGKESKTKQAGDKLSLSKGAF